MKSGLANRVERCSGYKTTIYINIEIVSSDVAAQQLKCHIGVKFVGDATPTNLKTN
jgi:hypothetical protein